MSFTKHVRTAIVLDTNPGFRSEVSALLKSAGVKVLRASHNGKLGYQEIAKSRVRCDLVIANMELDDINAIQFMSALRKNSRLKTTHVVIGLADDLLENVEGALSFGLSGFFKKPIPLEDLTQYLDERFAVFDEYETNELCLYNLAAADFYRAQKQFKNALSHLEENLKIRDSAKIWFDVGVCRAHLEDKPGAVEAFQKVLDLDHTYAGRVKEFSANYEFVDDINRKTSIVEEAIDFFGIPSQHVNGGFYDQHKLRHAVVCSTSFDDNATLRNMLNDMGLQDVSVHSRGKDALYDVKTKSIDLIVTSIQLEDMNALQLIDVVRRDFDRGKAPKILLWLEEGMTGNLVKSYQVGLDGFLLKPYSSDSLRDSLHQMMIDEAMLTATDPVARRLVKAALGHFRLGAYERGEELAEAAIAKDGDAGMPVLALAINLHGQGRREDAEPMYLKTLELNETLRPVCDRMRQRLDALLGKADQETGGENHTNTSVPEHEESAVNFDDQGNLGRTSDGLALNEDLGVEGGQTASIGTPVAISTPGRGGEESDNGPNTFGEEHDDELEDIGPQIGQPHRYPRPLSQSSVPASEGEHEQDDPEPDFDIDITLRKRDGVEIDETMALERGAAAVENKARASFPAATKKAASRKGLVTTASAVQAYETGAQEELFEVDEVQLKRREDAVEVDLGLDLIREPLTMSGGLKNSLNGKKHRARAPGNDAQAYQEQVFTAAARRQLNVMAEIPSSIIPTDTGGSEITTWMPPDILRKLAMPSEELVKDPHKATQLDVFGRSFQKVIEQARLFNGRIHCLGSQDQPEELTAYLAKIGKVMQGEQAGGRIDVTDRKLAGKIQKLTKKLASNSADEGLAADLGKLYMESGAVDMVFDRVHAHWNMNENLKLGRLGDAVRDAVKSGRGDELLREAMKTAKAATLLETVVKSGGGVRLLQESLTTGAGIHFLERYSESEGGIKVVEKDIKEGRGVRFLEKIISEGKGLRFLHELVEGGGGGAVLEASLQSSGAVRILGDVLKSGGGVSWQDDSVQPFTAAVLELHDPIVKLHGKFWQGKENSEKLLEAALKNLERKDVRVESEDFEDVLAADNYSLETFKKIFQQLKSRGDQQLTEDFYKHNASRYYEAPDLTSALGNKLLELGETDKAMNAFERALREDKDNYEYLKNMAVAALKEKKHNEAEKWCNRMLRVQPRNAEAYNLLGINCKKQEKYKQSIRYYMKGIKVDPESVKLFHNLAIAYAQIGQDERSKKMFRRAKQIQKMQHDLNADFDDFKQAG